MPRPSKALHIFVMFVPHEQNVSEINCSMMKPFECPTGSDTLEKSPPKCEAS